jgi:hypothetical protein
MHLILASNRVECCPEPFQMQAATPSSEADMRHCHIDEVEAWENDTDYRW